MGTELKKKKRVRARARVRTEVMIVPELKEGKKGFKITGLSLSHVKLLNSVLDRAVASSIALDVEADEHDTEEVLDYLFNITTTE
jgi:hypothetical protein